MDVVCDGVGLASQTCHTLGEMLALWVFRHRCEARMRDIYNECTPIIGE